MPSSSFNKNLQKYAELVVKVGLNIRQGQRLIVRAPLHTAPLVREIARSAYKLGARYVDVLWGDEELAKVRVETAPRDSYNEYPSWQVAGQMEMINKGDAMLSIASNNPDLLNGLDAEFIGNSQRTALKHNAPISTAVTRNAVNWCVIAASSPAWAKKVFPKLPVDKAEAKLWKAIFETTRVNLDNPIKEWEKHIKGLRERANFMQSKKFRALHYKGPGTDLTIGLPHGHKWISAQSMAENGIIFTANMPTEEMFTLPDRNRVDGHVTATMPLSYAGTLIDNFSLTFENGRIVNVQAKKGEAILKKLVETDEGASYLGEVALVPNSSPISKRGHLFYNTLFDENASCHIAIGRAYRFTMIGGEELNDEEFKQGGGNVSMTHVDFMIGSAKLDIDGIKQDGTRESIMRKGEWAFKV
jgi:aminopeptidase